MSDVTAGSRVAGIVGCCMLLLVGAALVGAGIWIGSAL